MMNLNNRNMNKANKSIPKKQAKNEPDAILCVSCDRYFYSGWMRKDEKDKYYCDNCYSMGIEAQSLRGQINDKEVEKLARALLNAPPRKRNKSKKRKS
jgi:hypothetical protein